jgi:hypothetical protein
MSNISASTAPVCMATAVTDKDNEVVTLWEDNA